MEHEVFQQRDDYHRPRDRRSLRHLQPVPFGPLTVNAPDNLEGFLRYNYPTLHRYTEEEQEKVNNHYPAALSFSTTPKQEL